MRYEDWGDRCPRRAGLHSVQTSVADVPVHYGAGDLTPPIDDDAPTHVLVPPMTASAAGWIDLVAQLRAVGPVVAPDSPGTLTSGGIGVCTSVYPLRRQHHLLREPTQLLPTIRGRGRCAAPWGAAMDDRGAPPASVRSGPWRKETAMPFERITVEPDKLEGRPCIRGMRISVETVVRLVAAGWSVDQIVDEYPDLEPADIREALEYAAASTDVHFHQFQTPA